jgi:hypothetical protein
MAGGHGEEVFVMVQASAAHQDTDRKKKWDAFLDAYSVYLRDPSMANAASRHLAGVALKASDETFSLEDFESSLGWKNEEIESR